MVRRESIGYRSIPSTFGPILLVWHRSADQVRVLRIVLPGEGDGSGETLACGTGACAVCVAGVLTGRTGRRVLAHLPGGDLELEWSEADNRVWMTGPAVEVFSGDWP